MALSPVFPISVPLWFCSGFQYQESSQFSSGEVEKAYQDYQHTHLVPECKKSKPCVFYISGSSEPYCPTGTSLHFQP